MTTLEDTEAFLEHYGVKGMRWGVRRSPAQLRSGKPSKAESRKGKARFARNLIVATAGSAFVGYTLANHGRTPVHAMMDKGSPRKTIQFEKHMRNAAKLRQSLGNASAPKTKSKVFSDSGDLAKMKAQAAQAVKEANAQLRKRDNDLDIPFAERSYLKEWT